MMVKTFRELLKNAEETNRTLDAIALDQEAQQSERSEAEILSQMDAIYCVMTEAAKEGIKKSEKSASGLSGGDAARLKAPMLLNPMMQDAVTMSLGINEASATQGKIVACPTAGSCGILPGVLLAFEKHQDSPKEEILKSLLTAGVIGQIIEHNACISGAEGGCQAECGAAAAMAAGALVQLSKGTPEQVIEGATLALKNLLGLVCDPVAGLVEVPCVKRNGILAGYSFIAAEMALQGIKSIIPPDEVVDAMYQIGQALPSSLRETAEGGLAVTPTGLKWKEELSK